MSQHKTIVSVYHASSRVKFWSKLGVFWGSIWGLMSGTVFFAVAGTGPILVGASLVSMIIAALEGGVVVGGLSAIGAGVFSICIPRDSSIQSETNLKGRRFLVLCHSSRLEIARVRDTLRRTPFVTLDLYALAGKRRIQDQVRAISA